MKPAFPPHFIAVPLRPKKRKLQEERQRKLERIAWLEKQLFGPKRDKRKPEDGPYDYFEYQEDVILLGCMAHVRRKFVEAQDSHPLAAAFVRHIFPDFPIGT